MWSILKLHVWDRVLHSDYSTVFDSNNWFKVFCQRFWFDYFKLPLDRLNNDWKFIYDRFRKYYFECEWFEVYDFLEFTAAKLPEVYREAFVVACNRSLQTEMSAYRFVNGQIVRITTEEEIAEIEEAIQGRNDPVRIHLRRALELLSDRKNPDYLNSIKESISSVESTFQIVLGKEDTLGRLIKKLEADIWPPSCPRQGIRSSVRIYVR